MNPLEKLREDVQYWREAARTAREALRVAEAVLPGLEAQLKELEPQPEPAPPGETIRPEPTATSTVASSSAEGEESPRFTGQCEEQVLQALTWKPGQSSEDLQKNLAKYGRAYGRGAVGYALRDLKARGKIVPSSKQGNVIFYQLAEPN